MSSLSGSRGRRAHKKEAAELDITSFMNLMIVLVPVLLMMMVFSRITVIELELPGLSKLPADTDLAKETLELEVSGDGLSIFFPQGYLVANIPMVQSKPTKQNMLDNSSQSSGSLEPSAMQHDFVQLQQTLIALKQTLLAKGIQKKGIVLLLQEDTDYQTIVSLIDKTRSYDEVLVTSVVQAELFPDVSLSDAPKRRAGAL